MGFQQGYKTVATRLEQCYMNKGEPEKSVPDYLMQPMSQLNTCFTSSQKMQGLH